ncbi:MAG TPA: hypothetical protein VGN37_04465 [Actinocatenispora sp.]
MADAASADGSHRFHEMLVDLYFLRRIVRPGGLVVMDGHTTPSVRTAVRYVVRNLGWTLVPDAFAGAARQPAAAERAPRCMAFRLLDSLVEPAFREFQPF